MKLFMLHKKTGENIIIFWESVIEVQQISYYSIYTYTWRVLLYYPDTRKMARRTSELSEMFAKSHALEDEIRKKLGVIGFEI